MTHAIENLVGCVLFAILMAFTACVLVVTLVRPAKRA